MSTLAPPPELHAEPDGTPGRTATAPSPFRGALRAVLRLHRAALWIWVGYAAFGALVLLWMWGPGGTAAAEQSAHCADHPCTDYSAVGRYKDPILAVNVLLRATLLLVPAWAGAALVGRELENRTNVVAWTQSISPARWLAAKLAVPAVLIALGTALLVLLYRLVRSAEFGVGNWGLYDVSVYFDAGPLPVVYPLLGLALGAFAAVLLRRALPALAVGVLGTGAVFALFWKVRFHLLPTETVRTASDRGPAGYHLREEAVLSGGRHVPKDVLGMCGRGPKCHEGVSGYFYEYHPLSHFWPLQALESGIVLAVAALAVAGAFVLVRRRTG